MKPHQHYSYEREEQRQSISIAFVCGIIIGLLVGITGTVMVLSALGEI